MRLGQEWKEAHQSQKLLYTAGLSVPSWGALLTHHDVSPKRPLAAQKAEHRPFFSRLNEGVGEKPKHFDGALALPKIETALLSCSSTTIVITYSTLQNTKIWCINSIPSEPRLPLVFFESSVSQHFPHLYWQRRANTPFKYRIFLWLHWNSISTFVPFLSDVAKITFSCWLHEGMAAMCPHHITTVRLTRQKPRFHKGGILGFLHLISTHLKIQCLCSLDY